MPRPDFSWSWEGRHLLPLRLPLGGPAPDFLLSDVVNGQPVHLQDFQGRKPVVLLFGSFGCDVFCKSLAHVKELYARHRARAEFLFIYVKEGPHQVLPQPAGPAETFATHILRGIHHFSVPFRCLRDATDGAVAKAYRVFPTQKLVIVDRQGRIALDAGGGLPDGWNLNEVETWLRAHAGAGPND